MPRSKKAFPWAELPRAELLKVRLCDLNVTLRGSWLESPIERVRGELKRRKLGFNPHFWLADEWFSPANVPGVALPFYLAHPRLMRLERSQMLEVEGGTPETCMMLLRHELGHAVQHAYQLHRRRRWQHCFGLASQPYPDAYQPRPASKRFVQHLDGWYAQSHPEEDFAETFAVWLRPRYNWRRRYAQWPALKKLEYVDDLMSQLAQEKPKVKSKERPYSLPTLRMTLGEHYERKRAHYVVDGSSIWDGDLRRLFREGKKDGRYETAAAFLRRNRVQIRQLVAKWTGDYQFTIDQVLKEMIYRCRGMGLVVVGKEEQLLLDFTIMLTVNSMQYLNRGHDWHPM